MVAAIRHPRKMNSHLSGNRFMWTRVKTANVVFVSSFRAGRVYRVVMEEIGDSHFVCFVGWEGKMSLVLVVENNVRIVKCIGIVLKRV